MHPLNGALPGPYLLARVTRGVQVANQYTYAPTHCRTSQYRRTFIPLSVSLWNDLADPYSIVWDCRVSRARAMFILIGLSCSIPTSVFYYFSLCLLSVHNFVLWGWGLWTDGVYITLSQPSTASSFNNNNNDNKNN